jgi:hypothetical protein
VTYTGGGSASVADGLAGSFIGEDGFVLDDTQIYHVPDNIIEAPRCRAG